MRKEESERRDYILQQNEVKVVEVKSSFKSEMLNSAKLDVV